MEYKCQETYGSRFCVNCGDCFFDDTDQDFNCVDNEEEKPSDAVQQV